MTKEREKLLIKRVKNGSFYLSDIGEEDQTDEIIDLAMEEDIDAFGFIKDDRKKTVDRCLRAVRGDGELLYYVPDQLKERVEEEIKNG